MQVPLTFTPSPASRSQSALSSRACRSRIRRNAWAVSACLIAGIIAACFRSDRFDVIAFAGSVSLHNRSEVQLDFDRHGRQPSSTCRSPNEGAAPQDARRSDMAAIVADQARENTPRASRNSSPLTFHIGCSFRWSRRSIWLRILHDPDIPSESLHTLAGRGSRGSRSDESRSFSQVFDMKMSLNRRKKPSTAMSNQLICAFARPARARSRPRLKIATAMNILGNDTLQRLDRPVAVASIWRATPAQRLNRDRLPGQAMPATGVPFIERVARDAIEIAGYEPSPQGQRVRLMLDATAAATSRARKPTCYSGKRPACRASENP